MKKKTNSLTPEKKRTERHILTQGLFTPNDNNPSAKGTELEPIQEAVKKL